MKKFNNTAAAASAIALIASLASCAVPTVWEDDVDDEWTGTYVRVDLTQNNEERGLFQWYPDYQLGVSYREYKNGSLVASKSNQNYIIDDHIKAQSYDWERFVYYSGNWSDQLPLPTESGETFDYACYAPYTNASLNDFDASQSALCPGTGSRASEVFYRQGSELDGSYDLLWANIGNVSKSNMSRYIETGPLYFDAEHALAKVYFVVEGLESRYELAGLSVRPSATNGALTQGYFDPFGGTWSAEEAAKAPEWTWSGIALTRTNSTASTLSCPIYLLPTYAGSSQNSSLDYELTLSIDGQETTVSGTWTGTLSQNRVHCIKINKATGNAQASVSAY